MTPGHSYLHSPPGSILLPNSNYLITRIKLSPSHLKTQDAMGNGDSKPADQKKDTPPPSPPPQHTSEPETVMDSDFEPPVSKSSDEPMMR